MSSFFLLLTYFPCGPRTADCVVQAFISLDAFMHTHAHTCSSHVHKPHTSYAHIHSLTHFSSLLLWSVCSSPLLCTNSTYLPHGHTQTCIQTSITMIHWHSSNIYTHQAYTCTQTHSPICHHCYCDQLCSSPLLCTNSTSGWRGKWGSSHNGKWLCTNSTHAPTTTWRSSSAEEREEREESRPSRQ